MRKHRDELTRGDISLILDAAMADDEDYIFLRLLAKTGRRLGEIRYITVGDINLKDRYIWTRIEKTRREERRKIFIDDTTVVLLQRYIRGLGKDDRIFTMSLATMKRKPMQYARKAGLNKHVSCHSFRHYFITALIKAGWSYDSIRRLTGHKSITTLAIYDHAGVEIVENRFRDVLRDL